MLLAAVPLAGLTAYIALRRVVPSVPLRVWGAVTYALLPPVLGAVATGRLGTSVVAVLLPPPRWPPGARWASTGSRRAGGLPGRPGCWSR